MSTTSDFGYNYVFELASRLTPEEQAMLIEDLGKPKKEMKIVEMTVSTGNPIFTEEDFARFQKAREELEASIDWEKAKRDHEELGRLLRECPMATEEEIEMQNEVRSAMERWKV